MDVIVKNSWLCGRKLRLMMSKELPKCKRLSRIWNKLLVVRLYIRQCCQDVISKLNKKNGNRSESNFAGGVFGVRA